MSAYLAQSSPRMLHRHEFRRSCIRQRVPVESPSVYHLLPVGVNDFDSLAGSYQRSFAATGRNGKQTKGLALEQLPSYDGSDACPTVAGCGLVSGPV